MLADSDEEFETNGVISKVLDEIGIEISGKVNILYIAIFRLNTWKLVKKNNDDQEFSFPNKCFCQ